MNKFPSTTVNGGTTVVLTSVGQAIKLGREWLERTVKICQARDQKGEFEASYIQRNSICKHCKETRADHNVQVRSGTTHYFCKGEDTEYECPPAKGGTITNAQLTAQYERMLKRFEKCETAIQTGDEKLKDAIAEQVDVLSELVRDLAPSLAAGFAGFSRTNEDGVSAAPELVAMGEENCLFKRKQGAGDVRNGEGDGAYRIVINTDVEWWGNPSDNAALVGALAICLQQFRPVEIWIQQGFLGDSPYDGITLFKLDFTAGALDPTQLAFWLGHPDKDSTFSFAINRELNRSGESAATTSEIPCDLYLRGDFLKLFGVDENNFRNLLHTEKTDLMARWIAQTAMRVVLNETVEILLEVHDE